MLILDVDDELGVLRMATTALAIGGYRAIVAENGVRPIVWYAAIAPGLRMNSQARNRYESLAWIP